VSLCAAELLTTNKLSELACLALCHCVQHPVSLCHCAQYPVSLCHCVTVSLCAAELVTTNKLSELACLALYLMYEKKRGPDSFWLPFIQELDRQRGRGQSAIETPSSGSRRK